MERMDLYDAQRRPLGRTAERGEKLPEGIYHLMAHILVFHPDGRILIQRRQPGPGCGTLPPGAAPWPGRTPPGPPCGRHGRSWASRWS